MLSNSVSRLLFARLAALLPLGLLFVPNLAWAQATSVGAVMTAAHGQFVWAIPLISAVCYVIGTAMVIQILNRAVQYSENTAKGGALGMFWRTLGASAFFQMPQAMNVLQTSLFNNVNKFGWSGSLNTVSGEGLDSALVHMVKDIAPGLMLLVGLIAFTSGTLLIASGISALSNQGFQQDQVTKKGIVVRFGVGTALITFAPFITTILQTMFSTSTANAIATLAYDNVGLAAADAARIDNVFNAIFVWLGLIGLIAILRGLWVLYGSLEGKGGPGSLMAPLTHMIAGAALLNIVPAIKLVEETIGCGANSACQILG